MNEQTTTINSEPVLFKDKLLGALRSIRYKIADSMRTKNYCYLSFAIPIIILFITSACMGMFPFGEKTVLTLDTDGQYIYFFEQIRDVYTGEESLFYTFQRCLGGDFLGYFTYYLASPLSILVAIFPKNMITEAVMTIIMLKSAFSGLTFSIYLGKTRKRNPVGFVIFSVMYALCSYATMYQFNPMWMDALIWLPLIALGIESMVCQGKFKLFTISLALAVCSNYYIGYMLCFFVFIYFFFCLGTKYKKSSSEFSEKKHLLKTFIRIALFSVIALMLACAIILSAYYSLSTGKTGYQDSTLDSTLRFDLLHLVSKMFLGSFDTLRLEGTPNIYAGLLILLMLPAFYMAKNVSPREKIGYTVLFIVFIACFSINSIDIAWHGFQTPVWFNYRYSFMFSFVMLSMAYRGYEEYDDLGVTFFGKISVFLILLLTVIQKVVVLYRYENPNGTGWEKVDTVPGYGMVWLSILFILLYLLVIYIRNKFNFKKATTIALALVVFVELFANTAVNWTGAFKDGGWASRSDYLAYVENLEEVTDEIYLKDPSLYRIERSMWRKQNDNLAININGLSESTSTFNEKTVLFMKALGFHTSSPTAQYISGNAAIDSILGIKYVIGSSENDNNGPLPGLNNVSSLYSSYESLNGYTVYVNPYVLPFAYRVNNYIKDFEFDQNEKSPFKNYNRLVGYMLGKDDARIFETCHYTTSVTVKPDAEGGLSFSNSNSGDENDFYFTVTAHTDGNIYMYLPSPWSTPAKLTVDGKVAINEYFKHETKRVIDLGYYEQGQTIKVGLTYSDWRIYLWNTMDYFVQVNDTTLKAVTDVLKKDGLNVTDYSDTKIIGTVNSSNDGTVFTTVPYDKNWNVYVDGERVETYMLAGALLGFDVEKGEHTVEMKYVHKPFIIGSCISVVGIGLFVALCILDKKYRGKLTKVNAEKCPPSSDEKAEDAPKNESSEENYDIPS